MLLKKCILQVTQETSNKQLQMPSSKQFRKSYFPKYCQYYWHFLKTKQKHTVFLLYFLFTSLKRVTFPTSSLEEAPKECSFTLHLIWSNYRCPTLSYLTFPLLLLHHNNRVTTLEAICCFDGKTHLEGEEGMQEYSLSSAHSWIRLHTV